MKSVRSIASVAAVAPLLLLAAWPAAAEEAAGRARGLEEARNGG